MVLVLLCNTGCNIEQFQQNTVTVDNWANPNKSNKTKVHLTALFGLLYILLNLCFVHHIVLFVSNNPNSTIWWTFVFFLFCFVWVSEFPKNSNGGFVTQEMFSSFLIRNLHWIRTSTWDYDLMYKLSTFNIFISIYIH